MYATISFSRAVNMLKKGPPPHFSMDILRSEGLTSKHARASRTAANMDWKQCMQKCVAQGLRQGRRHSLLQRRQKRPRQGLQKLQNLSIHRQIRCGLHAGAMVCDFGKGHWQYLGPGLMAMFLTLQRDSLSGTTKTTQRSETTQAFQKSNSACYPPNSQAWTQCKTLPHHSFLPRHKILLHDVLVQGWPQNLIICSAPLLGPFAFATCISN